MEKFLAKSYAVKQMPCPDFFSGPEVDYPKVLTNSDAVTYSHGVKPSDSFFSDKLPVGHKANNAIIPEQSAEPLDKLLAFRPLGVATLGHKFEYQRAYNSLVCHSKHEDIDIEITEFPVDAVHAQNKILLVWKQGEYHSFKRVFGKESLESVYVGSLLMAAGMVVVNLWRLRSVPHKACG